MRSDQKFVSQMTCMCIDFFGFLSWPKSNRLNFSLQAHLNFKFFRSNWVGLSVHPTVFKTRLNSSNELIKKKNFKKRKKPVPSGKSTCNLVLSFIANYLALGFIILKENNKIVKNDKERNASFGKSMVT